MIISPFMIYLISMADNILMILTVILTLIIAVAIVATLKYFIDLDCRESDDVLKTDKKYMKISFIICMIATFAIIFIPSKKTIIAMYTIPPIVNNKEVQQLPANLLKFANDYLTKEEKDNDK
jgi:hypothetical protein